MSSTKPYSARPKNNDSFPFVFAFPTISNATTYLTLPIKALHARKLRVSRSAPHNLSHVLAERALWLAQTRDYVHRWQRNLLFARYFLPIYVGKWTSALELGVGVGRTEPCTVDT